ncbi:MAG: hypothetical protein JWL73_1725 [Actinomycetia bacterium]|nr:hypothetical protein [Actinomycetes bacterium]
MAAQLRTKDLLPEPVLLSDPATERIRGGLVGGAVFCLGIGVVLLAVGLYLQGVFMLGVASLCTGLALNR